MKNFLWAGILGASLSLSYGYALIEPFEAYQTAAIGYRMTNDIGGPANLGEEYRRNVPILYYSCDASFLTYFGPQGQAEVGKAFNVLNNLKRVSEYSPDMSEVPLQTVRMNWTAEALALLDLKSTVLSMMPEQLGLAEPERYTWTLHDRFLLQNGRCPTGEAYLVVQRNYDLVMGTSYSQSQASAYVNNVLYSYEIVENCGAGGAGVSYSALAAPFPVDPLADSFSAIAGWAGLNVYGAFIPGLTRDDVAGFRSLISTNTTNLESPGPNTTVIKTNFDAPQWLITSNLSVFATFAATNDAAGLAALYPGLVDNAITNPLDPFRLVFTTNIYVGYYTNAPWDPYGTPPRPVLVTNISGPTVYPNIIHSFANVYVLSNSSKGIVLVPLTTIPKPNGTTRVTVQDINIGPFTSPWTPIPTNGATTNLVYTNITVYPKTVPWINGDFVIAPTNSCGWVLRSVLYTNVTVVTNVIISPVTNLTVTATTTNYTSFERDYIVYLTNHILVTYPISCDAATPMVYQGVEKITFVERVYDSLLNRFFAPITNQYTLNSVTNYEIVPLRIQRVVTQPDFLLVAQDTLAAPPLSIEVRTPPAFNSTYIIPNLNGPGTIESPTTFTFNKGGPVYENEGLVDTNSFLGQLTQIPVFAWGTYDGTTNAPIVYPNARSITDLENQMLIQVTPADLPDAAANSPYTVQLRIQSSTAGFRPPYTWALAADSPSLPPGLSISPGADTTTISITGTPPAGSQGFYYFMFQITDGKGNAIYRNFSININ
jgi:hypothetical protein